MTESLAGIRVRDIGAFELKRAYQSNLALGLLLAAGIHLAVVGAMWLFAGQNVVPPTIEPAVFADPGTIIVSPPPSIVPEEPKGVPGGGLVPPAFGIPRPVPDVLVRSEPVIPTRDDLHRYVPGARTAVPGTPSGRTEGIVRDTFPAIDVFVFGVRDPVPIREVTPVYPAMAERAGLTGDVMVRVLVDALGRVHDAVIVRCSPPGMGFEESARDALLQWVFTPAIQNDHPVAVWIMVPVRFATE